MAADLTGRYAWPGGSRLARELEAVVSCRALRVCDLGCGTGVLGRLALTCGANEVAFLDGADDAVETLRKEFAGDIRVRVEQHLWGTPMPGGPYDLILGGDLLYRPDYVRSLLSSISSGLTECGSCLLADPRRRLEADLPHLALGAGLTWHSDWRGDFTLVRLHRPGMGGRT